jgi:hypothetical protein
MLKKKQQQKDIPTNIHQENGEFGKFHLASYDDTVMMLTQAELTNAASSKLCIIQRSSPKRFV